MLVLALLVAAAVSGLPKVQREKVVAVFEVASPDHLPRHPPDHVGRADRRVRRHGVHGREVRRHVADEPRPADGRPSGAPARCSCSACSALVARIVGLLDHAPDPPDPRRAADHPRHLLVRDRAAAAAGQAPGRGRLQARHRRRDPDRLLVQPRRHLHLPHARRAVHRPGGGAGHAAGDADRPARADGADLQGRRGDHGRRPRDARPRRCRRSAATTSPPRRSPSASRSWSGSTGS